MSKTTKTEIYYVCIKATVVIKGHEQIITVWPTWRKHKGHRDPNQLLQEVADDTEGLLHLAHSLACYGCLTDTYAEEDVAASLFDPNNWDEQTADYFLPLINSLKQFVASKGTLGKEYLDETVYLIVQSLDTEL